MPANIAQVTSSLRAMRSAIISAHSSANTLALAPNQPDRPALSALTERIANLYGDLTAVLLTLSQEQNRSDQRRPSTRLARSFMAEVLDEPGMSDKEKLAALADAIFDAREPEAANDNDELPDFKKTVISIIRELHRA